MIRSNHRVISIIRFRVIDAPPKHGALAKHWRNTGNGHQRPDRLLLLGRLGVAVDQQDPGDQVRIIGHRDVPAARKRDEPRLGSYRWLVS
jgi:hypothetical protein